MPRSLSKNKMTQHTDASLDVETKEKETALKIQALRDMINAAEKTIQGARAMLLQIEGKKKEGRKRKVEDVTDGTVVEGSFDGQIMIGNDGKQYPVPANYASKSKLIEGDILKLTITPEGSFIYKQIGPTERKHALGVISQDEAGNFIILADGRPYKVLLASVTYFKGEPGDEVAIVAPRDNNATWASIENIIQKGSHKMSHWMPPREHIRRDEDEEMTDTEKAKEVEEAEEVESIVDSRNRESTTEEHDDHEDAVQTVSHHDWKDGLEETSETETAADDTVVTPVEESASPETKQAAIDDWAKDLEEIEREMRKDITA